MPGGLCRWTTLDWLPMTSGWSKKHEILENKYHREWNTARLLRKKPFVGSRPKFTKKPGVNLGWFSFCCFTVCLVWKGFSCFGFVLFSDKGLCSPDWSWTHRGTEAALELTLHLLASSSTVMLEEWAWLPGLNSRDHCWKRREEKEGKSRESGRKEGSREGERGNYGW